MFHVHLVLSNIDYQELLRKISPLIEKTIDEDSSWSAKTTRLLLSEGGVFRKILEVMAKENSIIPKDKLVSMAIMANRDKIRRILNQAMSENHIPLQILRFVVDSKRDKEKSMLNIQVTLNDIDYNKVVELMVPKLLDMLSAKDEKLSQVVDLITKIEGMPNKLILAALDTLPQDTKDDLIAKIFAIYKDEIETMVNHIVSKEVPVEISHIHISKE